LYLLTLEIGEDFRAVSAIIMNIGFSLGGILFIPVAYYLQDWRIQMRYFMGMPLIILALLDYFILESPK
jgi:hypothetical protein